MEMDGRNEKTETEYQTLLVDQVTQQVVRAMKGELQSVPRISEHRCIYRVPKSLRYINEDAYVPLLVSLGPFHHDNEGLKAMEDQKWRYFESFIGDNSIDLDALVRLMKRNESKARGFYAESIGLSSEHFVKVMLVDAIFVIYLLLEIHNPETIVTGIYHWDFIKNYVFRDMLLLENQLPFFILQEILDLAKCTSGTITERRSITELTYRLFQRFDMTHESVTDLDNSSEVRHFVDFQRLLYLPKAKREETQFEEIGSITELYKAGVIFKVASEKKLFDIDFKNGVLYIPNITVSDITETCFLNLLAYDQCHHGSSPISHYFVLMGMLIHTSDDVELLVRNRILKNNLSSNQEVAKVFNNLQKEMAFDSSYYYYSDVCTKINTHSGISWHKWMATLNQNYLNTHWKVISVIAASILLVFTLIQTVCSVISLP